MTSTINSRVAIQARIAEWRRHYHNDFASTLLVPDIRADRVRWFRAA